MLDGLEGTLDELERLKTKNNTSGQKLEVTEDTFRNITKDGKHVVFNAYIDGTRTNWIRAMGFSRSNQSLGNFRCLFWDGKMNPIISNETIVTMQILPFHSERYAPGICYPFCHTLVYATDFKEGVMAFS